jgi:hypothetical protein
MKKIKIYMLLLLSVMYTATKAQLGSGVDVTLTVNTPGVTIDGTRAAVQTLTSGGGSATLALDPMNNHNPIWAFGDKALVILMAQTPGPNPTRNWQIVDVQSYSANTLVLSDFAHTNWCTTGSGTCKLQVIRVPQHTYVNINAGGSLTCTPWDGSTGGALCFLAQNDVTIASGGWIDVSSKGFKNANTAGNAGAGGIVPPHQGANAAGPALQGKNGTLHNFDFFPKGQCVMAGGISGGDGGTGGFRTPGSAGLPGSTPETRLTLPAPAAHKLLFLGNGGRQGKGGTGGGAGGNGGNGGNSHPTAGLGGMGGFGMNGSNGGAGGPGGTGGGLIIIMANNVYTPGALCIDISGSPGGPGINGLASGGRGGNGGPGAKAVCVPPYFGYGSGGVRGQRGDGASGGGGGGGGSIGSFSIRTMPGGTNALSKTTDVKYNGGPGGAGGAGQNPWPTTAIDGADGCPLNMTAPPCAGVLCLKRVYREFNCACFEAYKVLGDMDQATDFGAYITYTKSAGSTAFSKKNGAPIDADPANYFAIYFKCSRLLMAYEDAGLPVTPIKKTPCIGGSPVPIYNEMRANLYWCKMDENPCGTCDIIHVDFKNDILAGNIMAPSSTILGSASSGGLLHEFGKVKFGKNGAVSKWEFDDDGPPFGINNTGTLYEISNPGDVCTKVCEPFRTEWIHLEHNYPCSCIPGTPGGPGGPPPNGGPFEHYPVLPYIPSLWDNPKKGDDGPPGDPGESDDSYFEGGDFDPSEETGWSEIMPPSTGLSSITATGKYYTISPNPTENEVTVMVNNAGITDQVEVKIFDIAGKLVWQKQDCIVNNKKITNDIGKLKSGTYFIQISNKQISETLKFIKQ